MHRVARTWPGSHRPTRAGTGLSCRMDRRLIGALLLVAAIAAGVVAAKGGGLRTVGTAVMGELPADPRVGDCLLEPAEGSVPEFAPRPWADLRPLATPAQTTLPDISRTIDGPRFGSCIGAGPVGGEVIALLSATGDERTRRQRAASTGIDCRAASLRYAGLRMIDNHFGLTQQATD